MSDTTEEQAHDIAEFEIAQDIQYERRPRMDKDGLVYQQAHRDNLRRIRAFEAEVARLRAAAEGVLRYVTPPRGDLRGMAAIGNLDAALRGEEAEDE